LVARAARSWPVSRRLSVGFIWFFLFVTFIFGVSRFVTVSMTRYATAASTKYRHRSDRSAPLSTTITGDYDTTRSNLRPKPLGLGGTGRDVALDECRPFAIVLSCANRQPDNLPFRTTVFLRRNRHVLFYHRIFVFCFMLLSTLDITKLHALI